MAADPPPFPSNGRSEEAKASARVLARTRRAAASANVPDAAERVRDRFIAELLPRLRLTAAPVVSGYSPIRDELDPRPLMVALADRGFRTAGPCVASVGSPLLFRLWDVKTPLALVGGIPEPPETAPAVEPDLLLVPLLAFDRSGHRLGYGRGFYDRTLEALRARRRAIAVGLAFAGQEMLSLPISDRDQRLDWIVTEEAVIHPKAETN